MQLLLSNNHGKGEIDYASALLCVHYKVINVFDTSRVLPVSKPMFLGQRNNHARKLYIVLAKHGLDLQKFMQKINTIAHSTTRRPSHGLHLQKFVQKMNTIAHSSTRRPSHGLDLQKFVQKMNTIAHSSTRRPSHGLDLQKFVQKMNTIAHSTTRRPSH